MNIRDFRRNLKQALDKAQSGECVHIERNGQAFELRCVHNQKKDKQRCVHDIAKYGCGCVKKEGSHICPKHKRL